jgi:hypothetical protein
VVLNAGGCGTEGASLMASARGAFFFSGSVFSAIRTGIVGVFGDFGGSLEEECTLGSAALNEKRRRRNLVKRNGFVVDDLILSRRAVQEITSRPFF